MPVTLFCALWKLNHKITASCPTKYTSQAIRQNVTNTKRELWNTNRLKSFQKLAKPIPFCPFVPSFVFAVLLIPSLNVLSDYFLVCQFGGGSHCLNVDKSRDTAPLMASRFKRILIVDSISLRHPLTRSSLTASTENGRFRRRASVSPVKIILYEQPIPNYEQRQWLLTFNDLYVDAEENKQAFFTVFILMTTLR